MRARAQIKSHPIHPMLVAFPVGLWISSLVFDLLAVASDNVFLAITGFYAIVAGCIGATLSAVAGTIDLFSVVPPNSSGRNRGYIHGALNALALLLFIFIAWRRGDPMARPDGISLALSLLGVIA